MSLTLASLSDNPTLREYAKGAAQSRLSARADFLAPTVAVARPTGRFKKYDAKHRFKVPKTERPSGGKAAEITFSSSDATYDCTYHAVDVPVDNQDADALEDLMDVAKESMDLAADVESLAHERTVIQAALEALGAGTNYNFKDTSIDPIDLIDAAIESVMKATLGVGELRIAFGPTAARLFKNHPNVRKQILKGKSDQGFNNLSIEDFGGLLLGQPKCQLVSMVEDTNPEGKDASYDFLLSDGIIIFAAGQNPTRYDPSFMKTFRKSGAWMKPRFYQREDGRAQVAGVDWSVDVQVTNSAAGIRLNAKTSA